VKIYDKPIDVIDRINVKGEHTPLKFRVMDEEGAYKSFKIESILCKDELKIRGQRVLVFECTTIINDVVMPLQLRFNVTSCKWVLFKI
jgi:hypothetical protein